MSSKDEKSSFRSSSAHTPVLAKKGEFRTIDGYLEKALHQNTGLLSTVKKQQTLRDEKTIRKVIDLRRSDRVRTQDRTKLNHTVSPLYLKTVSGKQPIQDDGFRDLSQERNQNDENQFSFFQRFITPVKPRQPTTTPIKSKSFLSISRGRSPSPVSTIYPDANLNILSRGFQRRRDILEIQQELSQLMKSSKDQEAKNLFLERVLRELKTPQNHPEITAYLDSIPTLQVHLQSRSIELRKRILQLEREIHEKTQDVDNLKVLHQTSQDRLISLLKKKFESEFVESEIRELSYKTERLRRIREQQLVESKTESHIQTLKFEERCREQIELVAIEMALNGGNFNDPEVLQLRREIKALQKQLNN